MGEQAAREIRDLTLAVYATAEGIARDRGLLLADTKLEFGRRRDGTIVLADEVLTPDSSRFWDAADVATRRPAGTVRQAVRPRLAAALIGLGPDLRRCAAAPAGRRHRRHPRQVHPGLRAPDPHPLRAVARASVIPAGARAPLRAVARASAIPAGPAPLFAP